MVFGWYKFSGLYECRGTKLISETDLSKCNKCYKMGTGAVSRYKRTTKAVICHVTESWIGGTGAVPGYRY